MGNRANKLQASALAALAACAATGSHALASFVPAQLTFDILSSAGSASPTDTATQIAPGVWAHTGGWAASGASIEWSSNTVGWNGTTGYGFMNSNVVFRNLTSTAQTFSFIASMDGSASGTSVLGGSVGGQFVNASESLGILSSSGPMWSAMIDGLTVNNQYDNALFFAQPYQVASLGNRNFSNQNNFGAIASAVSIRYSFTLSAGGEASFTSNFHFQVIPAPAAAAMLCLAPILGSRRRRGN